MTFGCQDTAMTLPQACARDRDAHKKNGRGSANDDLSVQCTNLSPETTRHIGSNIFVAQTPEVKNPKDDSSNRTWSGVSGQDRVEND